MNYQNVPKIQIGRGCNSRHKYAFSTKHAQKFHHCVFSQRVKKKSMTIFTHFQMDFFEKKLCVKSLHNLNIIKKNFWKILKIFFFAFTTFGQKLCGSLGKDKNRKNIFEKKNINNFTHIIRICPKVLDFLTYEIYYISLKHPKVFRL